jgi:CHAT domain-containing protein/tetratricopeptide (TPR) repeat protein
MSLNNLAEACREQGRYADAERLLTRARALLLRAVGEDHPSSALTVSNLGLLYLHMGDCRTAERLLEQAREIRRRVPGEEHPDYAVSLNNLARLYEDQGRLEQAEPLFQQAWEILERALGADHPTSAITLSNLSALAHCQRDYEQAEALCVQALEVRRRVLPPDHPDVALSLNNLAELHRQRGRYADAEPLYRQALDLYRRALGADHPSSVLPLNNLAILLAATGRPDEALRLSRQAAAINDRMIGQIFAVGSDRQRLGYLQTLQNNLGAFLSLVCRYLSTSPEAVGAAFDQVLRRKALAAEALAAQRDAVYGGRYPDLQPQLRRLTELRGEIAQATLAGPGVGGDLTAHRRLLDQLDADRERVEQELARQIPEMNLERHLRAADGRAVAVALPEGVALVEFVRFDVFDFGAVPARGETPWAPARYLAFVLAAGQPDVLQMIDLGEADPIDQMIADFRAGITGDDSERGRGMIPYLEDAPDHPGASAALAPVQGARLRQAVFDPLVPHLGGRTRLLLCPDGDLARLPFEVLPDTAGNRLIDGYEISYLSSGRDVLRFGGRASRPPSAPVVAADPDFDLRHLPLAASPPAGLAPGRKKGGILSWLLRWGRGSTRGEADTPAPPLAVATPGRASRDLDRARVCPLPGTRTEGEQIAALLAVEPWLEAHVLEARLKAVRSPRILHLATHGFFCKDQPHDPESGRWENPLLRSGLLLAGYNTWLARGELPAQAEDGILTAEDVAGLDLLDTELVVLSACETGLGQIHVGQGVFGLRRAFVVAGAKTLVMSLWRVPDQQTQELMVDFYRRLLAGVPRAAALRQAQLRLKSRYPEPCYWGAFICQGEPAALSAVGGGGAARAFGV